MKPNILTTVALALMITALAGFASANALHETTAAPANDSIVAMDITLNAYMPAETLTALPGTQVAADIVSEFAVTDAVLQEVSTTSQSSQAVQTLSSAEESMTEEPYAVVAQVSIAEIATSYMAASIYAYRLQCAIGV